MKVSDQTGEGRYLNYLLLPDLRGDLRLDTTENEQVGIRPWYSENQGTAAV